ncbi:MAG: tripartite tricarboxylate transporter permease [Xanthobacteraceae bacterium]
MAALQFLFTPLGVVFLILGVLVGLVFGVMPGLGGTTAIALLMPLTFALEANQAMLLMGGIMGAVSAGGSISAILINTPGTAPNAATCFDGYPLTQQGKAGLAIGAAAGASTIGGFIGLFTLIAVIPIMKSIVLLFGPPEYFMLALMGLTAIAASTGGQFLRGLIAGALGLILASVGYDAVGGTVRFTSSWRYLSEYLWDGIQLVPALTGLFALSEMIALSVSGGTIAPEGATGRVTSVLQGVWLAVKHWRTTLQGSAIGTFIGAVPGLGGTVAAFLAYTAAMQISKHPETFGKGNIEGVIGPEASNNSKDGGSLIPTLSFGIPGSAEMAIFLGVLVLHGIEPGPMLLIHHEGVMFSLILALLASTLFSNVIVVMVARPLALITRVDVHILVPVVIAAALAGVYALRQTVGDVVLAGIFGVLGYIMIRFGFPRVTLVIALILGELAERSYHQSLNMADGDWTVFFTRTVSLILFLLIIAFLFVPAIRAWRTRMRTGASTSRRLHDVLVTPDGTGAHAGFTRMMKIIHWRDFGAALVILAIGVGFLIWAESYTASAAEVPVLVAWITIVLALIDAAARTETTLGRALRRLANAENVIEWKMEGDDVATSRRISSAIFWVLAYLAGVAAVGFLLTTPIYIFLYMKLHGGKSFLASAISATATTLGIWLLFEIIFEYPLYPGLLLGGY